MSAKMGLSPQYALLDAHPSQGLLKLAIPMIIAFLFQTGFNIVDTIFVGRLGADAIAGVSLAFPFQMFVIALGSGFGIGAQSLIARSIGANRMRDANSAAGHALFLAVVSGALTTIIGLASMDALISSLDPPAEVYEYGMEYLGTILLGSLFIYLNVISNAVLRGEGDTKRPMKFMATAAVINTILDPIFIFTFGWGVEGAALATVISRIVVTGMVFHYLFVKRGAAVQPNLRGFTVDASILRRIVDVGVPASLSQLALSLSLFFLNDIISPFGRDALAAFGLGFRVESVVFLPMIGLSSAFVSAVGYFRGSSQPQKIRLIHRYSLRLLIAFMCLCSVVFFFLPDIILRIFTDEQGVLSIGRTYLRVLCVFYPLLPFSMLAASGFQGLGKGYPGLFLALIRSGAVSVPCAMLFTMVLGWPLAYIWLSIALGDALSSIVGHAWFVKGLRAYERSVGEKGAAMHAAQVH
jgi:putative MATE family efflux protein